MYGYLTSFSPYDLLPYYNAVLHTGVLLSGLLFVLAAHPFVRRRVSGRTIFSLPLTIILCPFYFVLLYLSFSGIRQLFKVVNGVLAAV